MLSEELVTFLQSIILEKKLCLLSFFCALVIPSIHFYNSFFIFLLNFTSLIQFSLVFDSPLSEFCPIFTCPFSLLFSESMACMLLFKLFCFLFLSLLFFFSPSIFLWSFSPPYKATIFGLILLISFFPFCFLVQVLYQKINL